MPFSIQLADHRFHWHIQQIIFHFVRTESHLNITCHHRTEEETFFYCNQSENQSIITFIPFHGLHSINDAINQLREFDECEMCLRWWRRSKGNKWTKVEKFVKNKHYIRPWIFCSSNTNISVKKIQNIFIEMSNKILWIFSTKSKIWPRSFSNCLDCVLFAHIVTSWNFNFQWKKHLISFSLSFHGSCDFGFIASKHFTLQRQTFERNHRNECRVFFFRFFLSHFNRANRTKWINNLRQTVNWSDDFWTVETKFLLVFYGRCLCYARRRFFFIWISTAPKIIFKAKCFFDFFSGSATQ